MAKAKREELLGKERQFAAGKPQLSSTAPLHNLKPGELAKVRSLNQTGYVLEVTGNEAQVQVGILKVGAKLNDLERVAPEPKTPIVHRYAAEAWVKAFRLSRR